METKINKLKELRKESISKNEKLLIDAYDSLLSKINDTTTDKDFDIIIVSYIKEKVDLATKFYRKKMIEEWGKENYIILLLSSLFLNNKYKTKINIDKKIVELIEDEYY